MLVWIVLMVEIYPKKSPKKVENAGPNHEIQYHLINHKIVIAYCSLPVVAKAHQLVHAKENNNNIYLKLINELISFASYLIEL